MSRALAELTERLHRQGLLGEPQAVFLRRIVLGDILSVRLELQALLYIGVLMIAGGAGILVKEHYDQLGPVTIAAAIGLAAFLCLIYVFRLAPPFSWKEVPSPTLAFDYILLLGLLLLASDLAYLEYQFTVLGENWPWHLLIVSLLYLAAAVRFDSRPVLSLALTSFAAWRGVAVTLSLGRGFIGAGEVRANAIGCGLLFLAAGVLAVRARRKPHFEPVFLNLGLMLLFGSLLSGIWMAPRISPAGISWGMALFICAGFDMAVARRLRRPAYFAYGILAAYLGLLRFIPREFMASGGFFFVTLTSLGIILFILKVRRDMKEGP